MKKIALLALIMFSGCGEDESELLTQQIERGVSVYTAKCSSCHGAMGQGTDLGPAVVGQGVFPKQPRQGAVRNVQFTTALDVFVWAKANMPGDAPGTMSDEDMLAVFAFDLDANGVTLEKPLDGDSASKIVLNP